MHHHFEHLDVQLAILLAFSLGLVMAVAFGSWGMSLTF